MSVERRDQQEALRHCLSSVLPSNLCSAYLAPNIKIMPLSWDVGKLSPSTSCLTADYGKTFTSTSQLPKHCVALLIHPKNELPAFAGLHTNMLPNLPGAASLCGECWPVLPIAAEAGRHKPALIQEPAGQNTHQNFQTSFNLFLKMNLHQAATAYSGKPGHLQLKERPWSQWKKSRQVLSSTALNYWCNRLRSFKRQ